MTQKLFEILESCGVSLSAPISLKDCNILRPYKLEKAGFSSSDELFAVILAVPYLTKQDERNLSAYAVCRDYHGYFKELFATLNAKLKVEYPCNRFAFFADDSPIAERDAAARACLGIIGDNGMLITEKYSSYVFLGEIITDLSFECEAKPIRSCEGCGACRRACPMSELGECLSAITQKKGELTAAEANAMKKHGTVWGCDICQETCPHTIRAIKSGTIYTDIEYFKSETLPQLTSEALAEMTDEQFASRAYSWRGRKTIARNLNIFENM